MQKSFHFYCRDQPLSSRVICSGFAVKGGFCNQKDWHSVDEECILCFLAQPLLQKHCRLKQWNISRPCVKVQGSFAGNSMLLFKFLCRSWVSITSDLQSLGHGVFVLSFGDCNKISWISLASKQLPWSSRPVWCIADRSATSERNKSTKPHRQEICLKTYLRK